MNRASFVALVADRSDTGQAAFREWMEQFPDLRAREEAWNTSGCQFLINLRQANGQPVVTILPRDEAELREQAIPEVFRRLKGTGATLVTRPRVAPALLPMLQAEFARYTTAPDADQ
ncbi:hypothetical protein [Ramlibacter alkalitolerans]|uniref:hypothetical protein n=1 Tax=Ramlibacter alkalitolerans TaxID=2039631 RepID=UPI001F28242B|nr:hypothetical protein [Ramlibacter alkalitolerans]